MPKSTQNLPPHATALEPKPAHLIPAADGQSTIDPAGQQTARDRYQALHDQIVTTRENLPGADTSDRDLLRDRAEEAQGVLTTLDREDLQANTPAFAQAAEQIEQANADMEELKNSIGGIIQDIQAADEFVAIADQAIAAATKFFA